MLRLASQHHLTWRTKQTEGGTGHPGFMSHKQPHVESNLRDRIEELGVATLCLGACVTAVKECDDWVDTTYIDSLGTQRTVRSRFIVGADGKTGFLRKQYLEPKGIILEHASTPWEQVWVAMNWKISYPTPASHPQFPLWDKGYTPQQVYDSFFPRDFRFLCNPVRAAVCGRFGLNDDRLWRFEFVVLEGEDSAEMATPHRISEVVHPYLTHPGSRYGLSAEHDTVTYPLDCIEVLRCRPFRFSARSCNRWALGRATLCGDAAHVFPPFGGQGIASAFRDAISLAWRLKIATGYSTAFNSEAVNYEKLLEGWYLERKQQLDASLKSTVENGYYVTESDPVKVFLRDWSLWCMQLIPSWRHWYRLGNRRDGLFRYDWQQDNGMAFLRDLGGGQNFPQVYVTPTIALDQRPNIGKVFFTDDIIFSSKSGLFQIIALLSPSKAVRTTRDDLDGLERSSGGCLRESEATIIFDTTEASSAIIGEHYHQVYRLATAAEFAEEHALSKGRPFPTGYNPHRMFEEVGSDKYVILRPDRHVFAVCSTRSDLLFAANKLRLLVQTGSIGL